MTSRACRALLALALFLGAGSLTSGGARAADAPAAESSAVKSSVAKPSVAVGIGAVTPQIPDFSDVNKPMDFSGQLANTTSAAMKNLVVELRRTRVQARSDMGSADGEGSRVYTAAGKQVKLPIPSLDAHAVTGWQFHLTEAELLGGKKPRSGVYAVDIDITDSDGDFLGGQRTYVVWKPVTDTKEARVALLWPVVGMPGLTGQKTANDAAAPIVSDPQAAAQFAPQGRLSQIFQDGQRFPVNWILDPDVLYTANRLSSGYFVASPDGSLKPEGGNGALDAKGWYDAAHQLFTASATQNCWNLPYADPDVTTLAHSQGGQPLLNAAVKLQAPVTTGACRKPQTIAWPAGGQADTATMKALQAAGVSDQLTLLSSNVVSSTAWKSAHVALPESPNTVVYDTYLSNVFADQAPPPAGQPQLSTPGVLAAQEWLAQTALLAGDYTDRVLVVAPPRDFTPTAPLADAIEKAEKMGPNDKWVGLQDLGKVLDPKAAAPPASPLVAKIDSPNLPVAVVKSASDGQKLYHALHSIMDPNHERDDAVPFRPVATWWRGRPGAAAFSGVVYNTVVQEHGLVSIAKQRQTLTLSGKSGMVPITIVNKTNSAVHVFVQAHSEQSVKLKATDPGLQTVTSGTTATVRIRVEAQGNGQTVKLMATLYTCDDFSSGCTYYPGDLFTPLKSEDGAVEIPVKVSRIGIIALGLMIGSGILLIALIGLRVYRAKRAQHAPAQDTMAS
ncbi:MAG: hypothetical protein HOV87_13300 [Catenulispora sp.]|nr:hypothetical protein [Catenulispora sp.]